MIKVANIKYQAVHHMSNNWHGGAREGAGRPKKGDHKRAVKITLNDAQNDYIIAKLAEGYKLAELLEELISDAMKKGEKRSWTKG